MNTATATELFTLEMSRTFNAPREAVFDAWTQAEAIRQWFISDPGMTSVVDELDLKPGGRYQFQMIQSNGEAYIVTGEYVSIRRPEQLAFTWQWTHGDMSDIMLVTLDFNRQGRRHRIEANPREAAE